MTSEPARPLVLPLDDPAADLDLAGGKGASLMRLAAGGLPVPAGFHVTTAAYRDFVHRGGLQDRILASVADVDPDDQEGIEAAAARIRELIAHHELPEATATAIRTAYRAVGDDTAVAVRSSATAEDLPELSFAGQQETYLNIRGGAALLAAVRRCWASLWTARAISYRARHGIPADDVALAVVVQELVPADAAGILFTADPVTGARDRLSVNAAWGLGEAVVGGQVTPDTVVVDRAGGQVVEEHVGDKTVMTVRTEDGTREQPVPADMRHRAVLSPADAAQLGRIGIRIDDLYGQPMDVEWARHDGRFFVLQARPITGLPGERQPTGERPTGTPAVGEAPAEEWNDSLAGDYLWTSGNLGEAIPSVMTPATWSLVRMFMAEAMALASLGGHRLSGNIGGRFYLNLSVTVSTADAVGGGKLVRGALDQTFGRVPDDVEIPRLPLSRWQILRITLPTSARYIRRVVSYLNRLPELLADAPARCAAAHDRIQAATSGGELAERWHAEIEPLLRDTSRMLAAGARKDGMGLIRIGPKLRRLVGEADANALLTGLHTSSDQLASLGPVVGLAQLARGEIDRATYARQWGHRCPDEFEVSAPRPAEDPGWIDRQLDGLREVTDDASTLLSRQEQVRAEAWERFRQRHPRKETRLRRQIAGAAGAFRAREAARSEVIRAFWVLRAFVLRAGELTGHGDDLFFLPIEEILTVLGGDDTPLAAVPARREAYRRYRSLPSYPTLIRGAFDPFRWAADPLRRSDVFDEHHDRAPAGDAITGYPGAAGVVEGRARVLASVEEGAALQPGEILVTTVTNVGWTPLFPRAAAVVTDVGAPLSHAAIVARELGIPAVVGCGNAMTSLRTGDRVRVDGEHGTVQVLQAADAEVV